MLWCSGSTTDCWFCDLGLVLTLACWEVAMARLLKSTGSWYSLDNHPKKAIRYHHHNYHIIFSLIFFFTFLYHFSIIFIHKSTSSYSNIVFRSNNIETTFTIFVHQIFNGQWTNNNTELCSQAQSTYLFFSKYFL